MNVTIQITRTNTFIYPVLSSHFKNSYGAYALELCAKIFLNLQCHFSKLKI